MPALCSDKSLTPEQQALASKWWLLAMKIAMRMYRSNQYVRMIGSRDDVASIAGVALVRAALAYRDDYTSPFTGEPVHFPRLLEACVVRRINREAGKAKDRARERVIVKPLSMATRAGSAMAGFSVKKLDTLEAREDVEQALRALHDRELTSVIHRYGLRGETPKKLREIAAIMGVTHERVRQFLGKAVQRMALYIKERTSE